MQSLQTFLSQLAEIVKSNELVATYRTKASYFTRCSAKLTFEVLLTFQLSLPRQSAQAAINRFIKEMGYDFTLHKQSVFEAREKLSHRIFIDLNNNYFLQNHVYTGSFRNYRGLRVIAVDGSVFEVPCGAEYFGVLNTVGEPAPKAQAFALIDVLNEFVVRAELMPYGTGETNMAKRMLVEFLASDSAGPNLFLFDRGFFSRDLCRKLDACTKFIFRVSSNVIGEVNEANEPDQTVVRRDKKQPDLRLRVINYVLPNGESEKLVTNIFDPSFTVEDFGMLYNMRWGVETGFLMLKERLQIENFSSAKKELILQDFFSSIFVYNMMTLAVIEADEANKTAEEAKLHEKMGKPKKHTYKPNKNIAISEIRNLLIDTFLEDDPDKRQILFQRVISMIRRNVIPIRPRRSTARKSKHNSAKFSFNKKRGLA